MSKPEIGVVKEAPYVDTEAAITYRYLRFGMVAMVVLLAVSMVIAQARGCWQTSLSGYYYSPVRSIFVGALIAIGLCLVVVRGCDRWQDIFLNTAGMLAPVVALVPTSNSDRCLSTAGSRAMIADTTPKEIAAVDIAAVQNNLAALFITGVLALVLAYALRKARPPVVEGERIARISVSFAITATLVVIGAGLFVFTDCFEQIAHYSAAVGMFVCLGVVVLIRSRASGNTPHGRIYKVVWIGMAASGLVALALDRLGFEYTVLALELVEIAFFVAFWLTRAHEDRGALPKLSGA